MPNQKDVKIFFTTPSFDYMYNRKAILSTLDTNSDSSALQDFCQNYNPSRQLIYRHPRYLWTSFTSCPLFPWLHALLAGQCSLNSGYFYPSLVFICITSLFALLGNANWLETQLVYHFQFAPYSFLSSVVSVIRWLLAVLAQPWVNI